jgi:hypothetical protein
MRSLALSATLLATALPLAAQANPFKTLKPGLKGEITYTLSGDVTGTSKSTSDGERVLHQQTGTTKMMGKTSNTSTWSLLTPDSIWTADLNKKEGMVAPNMGPAMAKAYEDLDGDAKKRLHQNMEDMGAMMSRMFNLAGVNAGEKLGTKTYAGQQCEERKFGPVTTCAMTKAPIMLHTQMSLMCFNFEETATAVSFSAPSGDAFTPPAGIAWKTDKNLQKPDSMAKGFVLYLSSQQLADSIAKAKAQMPQASSAGNGQSPQMTPEQQASMQKACEAIKNFDMGKVLADATNQMMKEIAESAKRQAVESGKEAATSKIKGLFKKPKIP